MGEMEQKYGFLKFFLFFEKKVMKKLFYSKNYYYLCTRKTKEWLRSSTE